MKELDKYNVLELEQNKLDEINGGVFPFLIGYAIGVVIGAGGVTAGYQIAKHHATK